MDVKLSPYEIAEPGIFQTPMFFHTVMVNGEMARDLLLFNHEPEVGKEATNRKASKVKIEEYRDAYLAGEWQLSPQPLIFSNNSNGSYEQEDGQQRLKALVLASLVDPDIQVPFTICFDAPLSAKDVLDSGKPRTTADVLRMSGFANSSPLAAALRLLYCYYQVPYTSADSWRAFKMTPHKQKAFLKEHDGLVQGLQVARDLRSMLPQHIGAVVWHLAAQEHGVFPASEFVAGLQKGENMGPADARYVLREFLAKARYQHRKWEAQEQFALTIKAFNAWIMRVDGWRPYFRRLESFPRMVTVDKVPQILTAD